ncbi:MAG: rRNA maturation RNase YbeY [Planctomycetota bacterium]
MQVLWDRCVEDASERGFLSDSLVRETVQTAAASLGYCQGEVGVRITDNETIRAINVRHLQHDYETDVISFPYHLDTAAKTFEGELVVSLPFARSSVVAQDNWNVVEELRLYIIHGVLHLCGMDDRTPDQKQAMRQAESTVLSTLGLDVAAAMEGFEA